MKVSLTKEEKRNLRKKKIKISALIDFDPAELAVLLNVSSARAKEIYALVSFQKIPSIGVKFAEDLIAMGYYSIEALKGKSGPALFNAYEQLMGCTIDLCVEDQFRLAVHYAEQGDVGKKWWDFTPERKKYRLENGFPADRPKKTWQELINT